MQGMRFLILNENGQAVNHGVITQQITQDRFMCTFMRPPQVSRLVHVDEIGQWNLFPNDEAMNQFISALQPQGVEVPDGDTPPPADPPGDDVPPPTPPRKKAAKKKVSKKRNAKA